MPAMPARAKRYSSRTCNSRMPRTDRSSAIGTWPRTTGSMTKCQGSTAPRTYCSSEGRMGVIYHAHARFFTRKQGKVTVPAPVDPGTPNVPWWYDYIADKAQDLAQVGFTAIMYPPVSKTQSGHWPTGDGYGVFDQYDIGWKDQVGARETRFGNREQLQRSIAIARACGLEVYLDVVM